MNKIFHWIYILETPFQTGYLKTSGLDSNPQKI